MIVLSWLFHLTAWLCNLLTFFRLLGKHDFEPGEDMTFEQLTDSSFTQTDPIFSFSAG